MFANVEYCRACGLEFAPERLSNRGLCEGCARERLLESIRQLQIREGWVWEKWKRSYVAAMSGVIQRLSE